MSVGSARKSAIVTLVVVAMLVSGSLAVALPLSSPDNSSTDPKLKMYNDPSGTIELEKKDGLYVVKTGDLVYVQLINLFDNTILASGTTMLNGEMEVAIHYSQNGINYDLLFQHVMVQDKKSQILPWRIGDFNGDGVFNPNDSRDAGIVCNTSGTVLYGKITSTGFLDLLTAYNLAPDFVGCPLTNSSSDNSSSSGGDSSQDSNNNTGGSSGSSGSGSGSDSGSNNSGNNGSGNGSSSNNNNSGHGSGNNDNLINNPCVSDRIHGNIRISDEVRVYFEDCEVKGNIKIKHSLVEFVESQIRGNLESKYSKVIIEKSEIRGNIHIKDGKHSELIIKNTEIRGNVHVEEGLVTLINSTIDGNLHCKDVDYTNSGSTVKGNIHGCLLDDEGDDDDEDDEDED